MWFEVQGETIQQSPSLSYSYTKHMVEVYYWLYASVQILSPANNRRYHLDLSRLSFNSIDWRVGHLSSDKNLLEMIMNMQITKSRQVEQWNRQVALPWGGRFPWPSWIAEYEVLVCEFRSVSIPLIAALPKSSTRTQLKVFLCPVFSYRSL